MIAMNYDRSFGSCSLEKLPILAIGKVNSKDLNLYSYYFGKRFSKL